MFTSHSISTQGKLLVCNWNEELEILRIIRFKVNRYCSPGPAKIDSNDV